MIALLLFCLIPVDLLVIEHVPILEINTFYDENGCFVFDQIIFRELDNEVRDWRLLKTSRKTYTEDELKVKIEETREQLVKEWELKEWRHGQRVPFIPEWIGISGLDEHAKKYIFKDGDVTRCITYDRIERTYTQFDPELVAREILPKEKRRLLRSVK